MLFRCPSCDAAFSPRGRSTRAWVCACGGLIEEADGGPVFRDRPEKPGPSYSDLREGMRGTFLGRAFTLLGRVRRGDGGADWDEWNAEFADGSSGWLADTGDAMAFFLPYPGAAPVDPVSLSLDAVAEIGGRRWRVRERRSVRSLGAEGEFRSLPEPGARVEVVDLEGEKEGFATLETHAGRSALFLGKLCEASNLGLAEGNGAVSLKPAARSREASCPGCKTRRELRTGARCRSWVCAKCATLWHDSGGANPVSKEALPVWAESRPYLPLGGRGTLRGVEWTVVGRLRRMEKRSRFQWTEYLLHHPFRGFRWLVEANGNWSFGSQAAGPVKASGQRASWNGLDFRLYNRAEVSVAHADGEFPWPLAPKEKVATRDYIAPPYMLTQERTGKESNWTCNEYLPADEIRTAFRPSGMPLETGVAPNRPSPWDREAGVRVGISAACFFVVLLIQILAGRGSDVRVWRGEGALPDGDQFVSPPFTIPEGPRAAAVGFQADVDNDWMELQGELVDSARGTRRAFQVGAERWTGYDDEGPWASGSRSGQVTISSVPAGTYRLIGRITAGRGSAAPRGYVIHVDRNALFMSNFWITSLGLALMAAFVIWRRNAFERRRWSDSSENPWEAEDP